MSPDDLRAFAHTLAQGDPASGLPPITRITGHLLLDDTCFPCRGPQVEASWEAEDLPWYYAAPACGLSCNQNAVTITVRGARAGEPATVTVTPATSLFTIDNHAVTSARVVTGAVDVVPVGDQVHINGQLAPNAEITEKISVRDPERFIEELFRQALTAEGITFQQEDPEKIVTAADCTVLLTHQSSPLSDVLTLMLKESNNYIAEQLRWTFLARLRQEVALPQRFPALQADFAAHVGIDAESMHLVDGSGLSREDTITPQGIVRLLAYLATTPNFTAFYQALPIAGVDGTLQKRMLNTPAAQNVHAKTGTMRGISTLAGYVTKKDGEQLAFAVFVNGYGSGAVEARDLQDAIAIYLAGM